MVSKRGVKKNTTKNSGKKNNKSQENEETAEADSPELNAQTEQSDKNGQNGQNDQNNILLIGDDNLSFSQFIIEAYPVSNLYIASTLTELEINYMIRDLEMKKKIREKNEHIEKLNENSRTNLDAEIIDKEKNEPFYYTKKFKEKYANKNIHLIFNTNLFILKSYFPTNFFHTIFLILPGMCYNIKEKGLIYSDQITTLRLYYFIISIIIEVINVSIKNVQVHILWTTEKLKNLVENNNIAKSEINKEDDEKNSITNTLASLKNLVCNIDSENVNQISEERDPTQSNKDIEHSEKFYEEDADGNEVGANEVGVNGDEVDVDANEVDVDVDADADVNGNEVDADVDVNGNEIDADVNGNEIDADADGNEIDAYADVNGNEVDAYADAGAGADGNEVDIKLSNDPNICLDQENIDAENGQEEQPQKAGKADESDWVEESDEAENFDDEDKNEILDIFNLKNNIITKTVSELNEMEQTENDQIIYFVENKIQGNPLIANMWKFPLLYEIDLDKLMRLFNFESESSGDVNKGEPNVEADKGEPNVEADKEEPNAEADADEPNAEADADEPNVEVDLKINIDPNELSNKFVPIIYGKHFIYNNFLSKCKFYSFILKKKKKILIPEELAILMQNNIIGENYNIETYKDLKNIYYCIFKEIEKTYKTVKDQVHHISNIRYKLYLNRNKQENQNNNIIKQYMPFHVFQNNLNMKIKHKIILDELWKKIFTPINFGRANEDINKYFEFFVFSKFPKNRTIHKINKLYLKLNVSRRAYTDNNAKYSYTQNYKNNYHLINDNKNKPPLLPTPGKDMYKNSNHDKYKYNVSNSFKKINNVYKNTSSYNTSGVYNKMYRHDKSRNISNNYENKRELKNKTYGRSGENTHRSIRSNNINSQNHNNSFNSYNRNNHDNGSYNNIMNKSYNHSHNHGHNHGHNNRGTSHNHSHNMISYNNKTSRNNMHKSGDIRKDLKSIDGRSDTRGGGGRSQARSDFYNNHRYDNKNIKRRRDDSYETRQDEDNENYLNRRYDKKIRNNDYDMKSRIYDEKNQKKYSRNNTEMQDPYASTKDSNKYYDISNNEKNSEKKNWKFPPPPPNIPPLYDSQSQKRNSTFYHGSDDY
ncbi:conserved Plasmodium protein, unknown function [Plasmodium yoelii]|uniref:Uncharacterized protein n=1 Tax=Plasmodium yoelii TaxID=5861 RepID=A0A078KAL4_PLAYE|nr:conserved Plasmodium protein, unknown function [Plasmodium yoelii]CDU19428.1 conserved Plasmodium protein, unknown function [Plasmodium yoelii]VTZ80063.1 conserved Plasmodium protein, unknown function [Plasmodium yoelii]|eukprot:XP_724448.2 conserved Plasmodium protein, unknown function [Plasmodium yoelii]